MVFAVQIRRLVAGLGVTRTAVIGGGPAGAMTAFRLARAGRDVTLFERTKRAHHKVCGEFLSSEGRALLQRVGLTSAIKSSGTFVETFRLSHGDEVALAGLPFRGYSYSRFRLDDALLRECEKSGVRIFRGCAIRSLQRSGEEWRLATSDASRDFDDVVLASGKHDLRGHARSSGKDDYVGFKVNLRLRDEACERSRGHVDIMLFDGGYAGLELSEEGTATLALVRRRAVFAQEDGSFDALYSRMCAENRWASWLLRGSSPQWRRALSVSRIPYGYVFNSAGEPRLYRVGDQFAVIPSFSGDGISLALVSGVRCAEALLTGVSQERFHRSLYRAHAKQVRLALWLQRLAVRPRSQAWAVRVIARRPWLVRHLARWTRSPLPLSAPS